MKLHSGFPTMNMQVLNKNQSLELIEIINYQKTRRENIMHIVQPGETAESIARLYATSQENIERSGCEGACLLYEGEVILIKKRNRAIHIVRPLDTVAKIAAQYETSENAIITENNISQLFIGQMLVIPL